MRVNISSDEWWPVYSVYPAGKKYEVPDEIVKRWQDAQKVFDACQEEMLSVIRAAADAEKADRSG